MSNNVSKSNRNPHAIYFDEPGVTQQNFKDECDINIILERARNGVPISHLNARIAQYGDVSSIPDYRSALDTVNRANGLFMELDAKVRERFANDPAKFLAFAQNPANVDEMVRLGLAVPKPHDTPLESKAKGLPDDSGKGSKGHGKPISGANKGEPKGEDE